MYEIHYQLTRADLATYQNVATIRLKAAANNKPGAWKPLALWIGLVVLFAVGLHVAAQTTMIDTFSVMIGAWIGLVLAVALSAISLKRLRSAIYSDGGPSVSPQHAVFDDTGMHVKTSKINADYKWSLFNSLTQSKDQITLWLEPSSGIVIPLRAFATSTEATAFVAFARERIAAAAVTSPHTS